MAKALPIHKLTQPDAPLYTSAPVLLVRLQEMLEFAPAMRDPANIEELHNMRIAGKRLRYTLELFEPVLGPDAAPVLKTVEDVQEKLGAIHDCDVLIPLVEKTLDKKTGQEQKKATKKNGKLPRYLAAEGLARLLHEKRGERERLYHEFVAAWDALPPEDFAERITRLVHPAAEAPAN